ncbi:MAG TPA: helix-turn-helix transcriptional regulator [Acidimicrobiales bacterium]|jgi:tetratricopeptide (TPR) repeat protein
MADGGGRAVEALGLVRADPVGAEVVARGALVEAEAAGDVAGVAVARRVLGIVARDGQRFVEAREHFVAGIEAAERGGLVELAGLCRLSLATGLALVGDREGALAAVESAGSVLSGGDRARARFQRGAVLQSVGDHDAALSAYADAEPELRAFGDEVSLAQLHNNCGVIRVAAGDLVGAAADLERAERLYAKTGNRKARVDVCTHLALVAARRGDALAALGWYDEVDVELAALGVTDAVALKDRVEVLLAAGLTNEASAAASRAVGLLAAGGESVYLAEAMLARAAAEHAAGRAEVAAGVEREAVAMLTRLGMRPRPGVSSPPSAFRVIAPNMVDRRGRRALNDALRRMREARGVTQADLAAALGVDQALCSRWESNPDWNPRVDEVLAIDDALGQPRGSLLRAAGYLDDVATTEQAVMADAALGPDGRDAVLVLIRYYHQRAAAPHRRRGRKRNPRNHPTGD